MTQNQPRDAGNWAQPIAKLKVTDVPAGATNINVDGHQVQSPLQGFGQLVQKTYRVRLDGVKMTAVQVMQVWKENFAQFQPPENHFYPSMQGIKPGSIILIDGKVPPFPGMPAIMPVVAGVMILYVDDTSFTVMTPEGFPEAGWNTFSAFEENGVVCAQVQPLVRASDPLYELFYRFFGSSQQQDKTWTIVLISLAKYLGVEVKVESKKEVIIAQHVMAPAWVESHNNNYVGGDINGGAADLFQLYTRPTWSLTPYRTAAKGIYLCSSSTPPGGGVHGMSGYHAARVVLADM